MTTEDLGAKIERLLDELQTMAGPPAWSRVEALVASLVELYGTGLERILARARDAARDRGALDDELARDDLVANLLSLHGIHPIGVAERVERALERVRRDAPETATFSFEGFHDGVVVLRANGSSDASAIASAVVTRAITLEAPEVEAVRIEGLPPSPAHVANELISAERLVRRVRE